MKYFQILLKVILAFVLVIFAPIWIFNHVNPWLGFIAFPIGAILASYLFKTKTKNKQNETN